MAIRILPPNGNAPGGWKNRGRVTDAGARPRTLARRGKRQRLLTKVTAVSLICIATTLAYGLWLVGSIEAHLPDIRSLAEVRLNPATTIISSDGVVLATLETQDRRPVALSHISQNVVKATIATEDERYYQHCGVDLHGVARAFCANLLGGKARGQGGSTITQQLARNLYLSRQKTFRRKIEEILLARKIERSYTKDEILEAYLNTVYYGSGCYGIEAAAQNYFGKSASDLTLNEAALLAGVPQRPAAYAPNQHLAAALHRRDTVLNRMVDAGYLTRAQADATRRQRLPILPPRPQNIARWKAPYFVSDVLAHLREQYGNDAVYSGVRVETTLNWRMQRAAEDALQAGLKRSVANTGAIVTIEPQTGYVRTLVGGPDFRRSQFDAATRGVRQPGSAFKPLVYVTAFDTGICTLISQYNDEKSTYPNGGRGYVVHNYDNTYRGTMTVLDAVRRSTNTIAVRVGAATDPARIVRYAQRMGITSPLEPGLPLALGDSGVRPIDLCSAYSAFANGGIRSDPTLIVRITNVHGQVVWNDNVDSRRHVAFLTQRAIDQINVALREAVINGTGDAAAAIPDAHGKTGTTSGHRDAWFVGYTGELATAVWVAREKRSRARDAIGVYRTMLCYEPMSDATGGSLCAPIWRNFMSRAIAVQEHIDRTHGRNFQPVPAPDRASLLAALVVDARRIAKAQAAARLKAQSAEQPSTGAVQLAPAQFVPAQDGSGPIIVTAPPDPPQQDPQTDANSRETPPDTPTGDDPSAAHPGPDADGSPPGA